MNEIIKLKDVSKAYSNKVLALNQFNLSVGENELVAIMGKSGSGKSTVLNLIAGIDTVDSGMYLFQNKDMRQLSKDEFAKFRRKNLGFILQHYALMHGETVYDNIALPLRLEKVNKSERMERVHEVSKLLCIEDQLQKYPSALSGGEAQRVAIARAIIHHPKLILADEPTGALDEDNSRRIMDIFLKLKELGNTIIMVTHDHDVARVCDRIVTIKDGKCIKYL